MSLMPHNPLPDKPPMGLYGGAILFAAPERWDEACFAAPALRALRAARPHSTIGVICHEDQLCLWQSIEKIDAIITYDRRTKVSALAHALVESKKNWDAAILWEPNLSSDLCRSLKLKQILCYDAKPLSRIATDRVPLVKHIGPTQHRVQHYLDFLKALKIPYNKPEFFASSHARIAATPRKITLVPSSDFGPSHEWPAGCWKDLIERLQRDDREVSLLSLPQRDLPRELGGFQEITTKAAHWSDAYEALRSSPLTVASDSSIAHLSAHLGTPTLTLFGPNDSEWKRPLGKQNRVLFRKVECSPCLAPKCAMDLRCQKELTVDAVYSMICTMEQDH